MCGMLAGVDKVMKRGATTLALMVARTPEFEERDSSAGFKKNEGYDGLDRLEPQGNAIASESEPLVLTARREACLRPPG